MHDYVILNPQESSWALEAHLRVVILKDLDPDIVTLNHADEIGRVMIPNAFLPVNDDPWDHPAEEVVGAHLGGGYLEEAGVDPMGHQPDPRCP